MAMSKIAIVIAPSLADSFLLAGRSAAAVSLLGKIVDSVSLHDGIALIVANTHGDQAINSILQMADGILLICPEHDPEARGDDFVRKLGRAAVIEALNSVMIIGEKSFFGREKEWQDWAEFYGASAEQLAFEDGDALWYKLREFVRSAAIVSPFKRLAQGRRIDLGRNLKSPVTFS